MPWNPFGDEAAEANRGKTAGGRAGFYHVKVGSSCFCDG